MRRTGKFLLEIHRSLGIRVVATRELLEKSQVPRRTFQLSEDRIFRQTRVASRTFWCPKAFNAYYNAQTVLTGKNHAFLIFCICLQADYFTFLRAFDSAHSMLTQCSLSAHYSAHTVLTGENHAFRTFRIRMASSVSELPQLRSTKLLCFYSEHCVSTVVSTE